MIETAVDGGGGLIGRRRRRGGRGGCLRRLLPPDSVHGQDPVAFEIGGYENAEEEKQHERYGAVVNNRLPVGAAQGLGALGQEGGRDGGGDGVVEGGGAERRRQRKHARDARERKIGREGDVDLARRVGRQRVTGAVQHPEVVALALEPVEGVAGDVDRDRTHVA